MIGHGHAPGRTAGACPPAGAVLGIDVGWSAMRPSSAACLLWWTPGGVDWRAARFRAVEPERTDAIVAVAAGRALLAAAIDGPLAPGLGGIGRYRAAEALLTRGLAGLIGKPGAANSPGGRMLNAHANACARIVLDRLDVAPASHTQAIHERAIAEAFPGAFLGAILADPQAEPVTRGTRSDVFHRRLAADGTFGRLLARLLPGRVPARDPAALTDHDKRAAWACALTALCLAAGDHTAVGDPAYGWIMLPPRALIQPAVADRLLANTATVAAGRVEGPDWPAAR